MWQRQRRCVFLSKCGNSKRAEIGIAECIIMSNYLASDNPDLHSYFLGAWQFSRTMHTSDGALIGSAEGSAHFTAPGSADHLHYHETGKLTLVADARVISFSKRFDYWLEAAGSLHVVFADGPQAGESYQRYQYDAARHALLPLHTHICIADHYTGSYQLNDADHFDLHTRIDGPHKDYVVLTKYSRSATVSP